MDTDKLWERLQDEGFKGRVSSKNQIYCRCLDCGGNFSINLDKAMFICYSAGHGIKGHLSRIIGKEFFKDDISEFEISELERDLGSFFEFDFDTCINSGDCVSGSYVGALSETDGLDELRDFRFVHQMMIDRGFDRDFLIANRIGYDHKTMAVTIPHFERAEWGDWRERNLDGLIFYGVIRRTVLDWVKPRYLYPENFQRVHRIFRPIYVSQTCHVDQEGHHFIPKVLLIVEGSLDALRAAQHGYNAVALLGCYASDSQIRKIQKICALEGLTPILLLDKDKAGIEGTDKILSENPHFNCKVANIADLCYDVNVVGEVREPKDPGELSWRQFCEVVNKAKDRMEFELDSFRF